MNQTNLGWGRVLTRNLPFYGIFLDDHNSLLHLSGEVFSGQIWFRILIWTLSRPRKSSASIYMSCQSHIIWRKSRMVLLLLPFCARSCVLGLVMGYSGQSYRGFYIVGGFFVNTLLILWILDSLLIHHV